MLKELKEDVEKIKKIMCEQMEIDTENHSLLTAYYLQGIILGAKNTVPSSFEMSILWGKWTVNSLNKWKYLLWLGQHRVVRAVQYCSGEWGRVTHSAGRGET